MGFSEQDPFKRHPRHPKKSSQHMSPIYHFFQRLGNQRKPTARAKLDLKAEKPVFLRAPTCCAFQRRTCCGNGRTKGTEEEDPLFLEPAKTDSKPISMDQYFDSHHGVHAGSNRALQKVYHKRLGAEVKITVLNFKVVFPLLVPQEKMHSSQLPEHLGKQQIIPRKWCVCVCVAPPIIG